MKKTLLGIAVVASLTIAAATHAATVYVSSTVAAWAGTGALTDPYGSIQEAYASLWTTAGAHQIYLVSGTYTSENIGANPWGNALIDFNDGGGGAGGVIGGARAANTFTLQALTPGTVTIQRNTTAGQNQWPDGNNPRGLFSIGAADVSNMIIQDVTLDLVEGAALIAKAFGGAQGFTFNNVDLFLQSATYTSGIYGVDAGNETTGDVVFQNSDIYYNGTATWYAHLARFGNFGSPVNAMIDGSNTSRLWKWSGTGSYTDPTQHTILTDLTEIVAGSRNPNQYDYAQNGSNALGNNASSLFFVNYFLTTLPPADDDDDDAAAAPEPTTVALLALGAGLVIARRRMNS